MLALSDGELAVLGKAFDRAWDNFLRTGALSPKNLAESRAILATRILRSAYYGQRDEWRLARDALAYLQQVMGCSRHIHGQPNGMDDARRRRQAAWPRKQFMRGRKPVTAVTAEPPLFPLEGPGVASAAVAAHR